MLKNMVSDPSGSFTLRLNIEAIQNNFESLLNFPQSSRTYQGPALFIRGGASDYILDEDFNPYSAPLSRLPYGDPRRGKPLGPCGTERRVAGLVDQFVGKEGFFED